MTFNTHQIFLQTEGSCIDLRQWVERGMNYLESLQIAQNFQKILKGNNSYSIFGNYCFRTLFKYGVKIEIHPFTPWPYDAILWVQGVAPRGRLVPHMFVKISICRVPLHMSILLLASFCYYLSVNTICKASQADISNLSSIKHSRKRAYSVLHTLSFVGFAKMTSENQSGTVTIDFFRRENFANFTSYSAQNSIEKTAASVSNLLYVLRKRFKE